MVSLMVMMVSVMHGDGGSNSYFKMVVVAVLTLTL